MKKYISIVFLLLSTLSIAQNNSFVPKKGEIIFKRTTNITNQKQLDSSLQAYKNNAIKELLNQGFGGDFESLSPKADTASTISFVEMHMSSYKQITLGLDSNQQKLSYNLVFRDSVIGKYRRSEYDVKNFKQIRVKDSLIFGINNGSSNYSKKNKYKISYTEGVITEYPNDVKNIKGYNCFKVNFSANNFTMSLYVTKLIKSYYHPCFNIKQILDNYYPLEITTTQNKIKGLKNIFELTKISLSD